MILNRFRKQKTKSPIPTVVGIRHTSYDQIKMLQFCVGHPFYQYHEYGGSIIEKIIIQNTPEFLTTYCHERSRRGSPIVKAKFKPLMDSFQVENHEYVPVTTQGRTEWIESVSAPKS